ncbi:hypothetical protein [Actibacterium mucosum]|uniref:hypothetical protein n=1 Tax=Actibacterium mucosum TaxID=1087332 RepID=UPI0013788A95|nr:hypothetical protein [Actibacterium mucosum]
MFIRVLMSDDRKVTDVPGLVEQPMQNAKLKALLAAHDAKVNEWKEATSTPAKAPQGKE